MKKANNKQIKNDIQRLKRERADFIKKSLGKAQIIKRIGFNPGKEILSHVKPTAIYGEKRYLIKDLKRYLNKTKDGKDIFIELISGQSCFLPPIGKRHQGKLFIKK